MSYECKIIISNFPEEIKGKFIALKNNIVKQIKDNLINLG